MLPICVDLDGTLIVRDSLWGLFFQLLRHPSWHRTLWKPLSWPLIKYKLAQKTHLSSVQWHYNKDVLRQLRRWKDQQHPLLLITGASQRVAEAVASHVGVFQEALGSSPTLNFVGHQKASYLQRRFGPFGFIYIGDSWKDVPVWRWSQEIHVVRPSWLLRFYLLWWKKPQQALVIY